jgi:pimeloyl-ACP methyl ester carboxylesterase
MVWASELLHDFGGEGSIIHLAHANGFPPGAYRQLAMALTDTYHVVGLPARPLWPGSDPAGVPDWHPLADDLLRAFDALQLSAILAVGHSLGGVLTLWAAIARPDLFRAVVLVEPVILPLTWLCYMRLLRRLGLAARQPLVQGALHRRRVWPSRQDCFAHLRAKSVFARWSDDALWDYVNSGTCLREDGTVKLRYPPEWEAHIFSTAPVDIWHGVHRLTVPALLLRGEHSQTFMPAAQARLVRRLPQCQSVTVADAGHLVPMERPAETARLIGEFLEGRAGPS